MPVKVLGQNGGIFVPLRGSHRMQAGSERVWLRAGWLLAIHADSEGLDAGGCLLTALPMAAQGGDGSASRTLS